MTEFELGELSTIEGIKSWLESRVKQVKQNGTSDEMGIRTEARIDELENIVSVLSDLIKTRRAR
jgi:hypothetical protein